MPTGGTETPVTKTIGDVFQSKNLWAWFSSAVTNYYNGQTERGQDYSVGGSLGAPIGAAVGGKIVRIVHNDNSINDVVELQDSSGAVWLYQHINAKCKVGQTLGCGGIVGTENGFPTGGNCHYGYPNGDCYSSGPHIEVRYCPPGKWNIGTDSWDEPWVNPKAIFASLATQRAGSVDTGANSIVSAITGMATAVHITPNADVATLLYSIDVALELKNPFDVQEATFSFDTPLGSASIPDPVAYTGSVANNLINDMSALVVRGTFVLIGIIILYAVIENLFLQAANQVLEPIGGVQGAVKLGTSVAGGAVGAIA